MEQTVSCPPHMQEEFEEFVEMRYDTLSPENIYNKTLVMKSESDRCWELYRKTGKDEYTKEAIAWKYVDSFDQYNKEKPMCHLNFKLVINAYTIGLRIRSYDDAFTVEVFDPVDEELEWERKIFEDEEE